MYGCAFVYVYLSRSSRITPSLDSVDEPVNYRDVSRSYFHGNRVHPVEVNVIAADPFVDYPVTVSQIT